MTTRASLTITPLKPVPSHIGSEGSWDVTAVESISGVARAVGRVTCTGAAVTRRAKELVSAQHSELIVRAVIVEPLPRTEP